MRSPAGLLLSTAVLPAPVFAPADSAHLLQRTGWASHALGLAVRETLVCITVGAIAALGLPP